MTAQRLVGNCRMAIFQISVARNCFFTFSGVLTVVLILLFFMKLYRFARPDVANVHQKLNPLLKLANYRSDFKLNRFARPDVANVHQKVNPLLKLANYRSDFKLNDYSILAVAKVHQKANPQLTLANYRSDVEFAAIPEEDVLKTFSAQQLQRLFIKYLDNTDIICHRKLRMGSKGDGGWEVCDDIQWRPHGDCLIYSFGIGFDFSFDDHVTTTYHCLLYAFDPSMKTKPHNRSSLVHFYNWGIHNFDGFIEGKYPVFTLSSLKKKLGHKNRIIDIVKMDVEFAEWWALPKMVVDGDLAKIRQLYVEFHDFPMNTSEVLSRLNIFRSLEQAGFRKFYSHKNPLCPDGDKEYPGTISQCFEVHMVNINCKDELQ